MNETAARLRRLYRAALRGRGLRAARCAGARGAPGRPGLDSRAGRGASASSPSGKAAAAMLAGARRRCRRSASPSCRAGLRRRRRRGPRSALRLASRARPRRASRAARRALEFFASFGAAGRRSSASSREGPRRSSACRAPGLSLARRSAAVARLVAPRRPDRSRSTACARRSRRSRAGGSAARRGRAWSRSCSPTCRATGRRSWDPGRRSAGARGDLVRVVGSNRIGLAAAARCGPAAWARRRAISRRLAGEAREAGARFARAARAPRRRAQVLLAGGETTVGARAAGSGRGGREPRARARRRLGSSRPSADVALLAAGSDGQDGSSAAAGAFADGGTLARARRAASTPAGALARHDTHAVLRGASATSSSPGRRGPTSPTGPSRRARPIIAGSPDAADREEPGARLPRAIHRDPEPVRGVPDRARLPELLRSRDVQPRLPVGLSPLQPRARPRVRAVLPRGGRAGGDLRDGHAALRVRPARLVALVGDGHRQHPEAARGGRHPGAGARGATSAIRCCSSAATSRG